jgi:type I restriction enzyme S subunit
MPTVKLGDIAIESKETFCGDKKDVPIVGLEHLTPNEVTLSNWSINTDNTFTKMFRKGDVLFGRRRAYLKKAAVAPFDGICSGDITVIRAKNDKLCSELLPFIIQNHDFFDYAVGKSAGSLSPRVKWSHLQNYEFSLPEMSKQTEIAKLLWAINNTIEGYKSLLSVTDDLVKSQFIEMFGTVENPVSGTSYKKLGEVASYINGAAFKPEDWGTKGLPIIRIQNLTGTNKEFNYYDGNYPQEVEVNFGDVLISWSASLGVYLWEDDKAILNQHIFKVKFDKLPVERRFFMYAVEQELEKMADKTHGSTMRHIVKKDFENTLIAYPSVKQQKLFSSFAEKSDEAKRETNQALKDLNKLKYRVINESLSE